MRSSTSTEIIENMIKKKKKKKKYKYRFQEKKFNIHVFKFWNLIWCLIFEVNFNVF